MDGLDGVLDAGDVEMFSGDAERSVRDLQAAGHAVARTGAVPLVPGGDRFLQIGLRGYWPGPKTLAWMAEQGMRSYERTEIDVCDPGHAPGTGTPEPGGLTARRLLDAVRRIAYELPVVGMDVVEVSPPYDHAELTAYLANRVVLEALSGMARRRRGDAWDPTQPLLSGR